MANIQVLDQATINQIAAGEVIDRPASVVKELLENAIDAKATAITVEIKEGGIGFIRITDNGCGIAREDVKIAFLRHSTSKIRSAVDLLTVSSLGFRGEALSSIAAVGQVELITKTADSLTGTRYVIEGGEEKSLEEIGVPDGTTFIVRNLFFNTPARRKFLKSPMTEASYISDIVEKIALSHPDISIRFIVNNGSRLHTSGNGNLKDVIYNIYGREISSNLFQADYQCEFMKVKGFIGKPVISRGNRNFENYFINGRYVKSRIISRAIEDAYKPYMMQHKYPFTALNIYIDGNLLDVNVHPSKMELRFRNQDQIYPEIIKIIENILSGKELIQEAAYESEEEHKKIIRQEKTEQKKLVSYKPLPEPFEINRNFHGGNSCEKKADAVKYDHLKARPYSTVNEDKLKYHTERKITFDKGNIVNDEVNTDDREDRNDKKNIESNQTLPDSLQKEITVSQEKEDIINDKPQQMTMFDDRLLSKESRIRHKIIGQVFDTYWIVEYGEKMFIIDQHAAHEKVLFERTMKRLKERKTLSQSINPPVILSLNMGEEAMLLKYMDIFKQLGYEIEPFGGKEYAVRAVPYDLFSISKRELLIEILDNISDETAGRIDSNLIIEKVASMSCKAAVKGNNRLSVQEANELIDELLTLENPYNCPHGRPTIISMSKYELEKKFKRIV